MSARHLHDQIRDMSRDMLRDVEAHREDYIKAWLASTGLRPEECELHQEIRQTEDGVTYVCRVERRKVT